MSSEERRKILQMVADGKISAKEAATLMRTLEDSAGEEMEVIGAVPGAGGHEARSDGPEFDEVRKRALRFAMIPLWVGIVFTVLSAWAMFSIQQNAGLNFWFFCMSMPFVLGVLLIAMGAGNRSSRWLYVNVDRSQQNEWPRYITIALPLPLGLVNWFLKNFGSHIEGLKRTTVDEVVMAISMAKSITEPLIINVDDTDDGERVQVFIG
ncbi:MAG: hypothetical protein Q8L41_15385 [Anaerolineales bacterium]|nr:hypothetical protein [Anaerolineales bacterium]MDP2776627.1 hypothetical protein [Anaerolineales bacterium]